MGEKHVTLLEISDLKIRFDTARETVHALNGVNLELESNQTLGIIGESGCGKSVTALSIMGLVDSPPGVIEGGEIRYRGQNLLDLSESELNNIRGNEISMIYQDPMEALNPSLTIGYQVMEPLLEHTDVSKSTARERAVETLKQCGLADAERIMDDYPHGLSGGMQQRVMIAMGIITEPDLLIADEPTTALDVTIQAQILGLLSELKERLGMSMIFITHDIPVVNEVADRLAVMYAGRVAEVAATKDIVDNPMHPYTELLLESMPKSDRAPDRLPVIEGVVPTFDEEPTGCVFASRCPKHLGDECDSVAPILRESAEARSGQQTACHLYYDPSQDVITSEQNEQTSRNQDAKFGEENR